MGQKQMAQYQIEVPDETWEAWKETVPRSYNKLSDRIIELIEADLHCQHEQGRGAVEIIEDLDGET